MIFFFSIHNEGTWQMLQVVKGEVQNKTNLSGLKER